MKKRSEKTEIARSKRKHRKGKGRGQAAEKKRSPLHLVWKRGRARSAKVHACGAQINQEFQEISRECEGSPKNKRHASRSPRSSFRKFCGQRPKDEKKGKIGKAAASVRDGWKKETKIMKTCGTEASRSRKIQRSVSKSESTYVWLGRYCRKQASEGPHANLEDSGVISAKESTVASGITVSGAGIGES